MPFRDIRPSAPNALNHSPSESTGSDIAKGAAQASSSSSTSKRRRVPESVTRNACVNCKRARAKCDGNRPCARCATRVESSPCFYEIHIKQAKEELMKQIKELETKDHSTQQILRALSTDYQVREILQRLRNRESYDSIAEWLSPLEGFEGESPSESHHSLTDVDGRETPGTSSFRWTSVTSDSITLDHLFQLYFAWIHPVHTLFSEGHFVESFRNRSHIYCSPVLVNAICAMACYLHTNAQAEEIDRLRASFSDNVRSSIDAEDRSLTTVQAFAVMFLVDCARGKALRATSYLKAAVIGLSKVEVVNHESFPEVLRNTSRGIRSLSAEWAQITFQMPITPRYTVPQTDDDDNYDKLDEANWYFYRYVKDQCPAWSGLVATTNREKTKLTDIIYDVTTILYNESGPPIQAGQILQQYTRYVRWREKLPNSIGDLENNSQALPHVLSLLILYSNSVIQLLRPLLEFKDLPLNGIDQAIWNHAQTGLLLLDRYYRTHFTCRYQPVMQMFAVMHLCHVVARFFPGRIDADSKDGPAAVQFGIEVLMQSRAGFPVAGTLQELLRRTANEHSVRLPPSIYDSMGASHYPQPIFKMDDFIDACTRPSYLQPISEIHAKFHSNFSVDWEILSLGLRESLFGDRRLRVSNSEERAAQNLMQISSLLNKN